MTSFEQAPTTSSERGLTKEILDEALARLRAQESLQAPSYRIPAARHLPDAMMRAIGALSDAEVTDMAYVGLMLVQAQQSMHPRLACALRVAHARSGAESGLATAPELTQWLLEHM